MYKFVNLLQGSREWLDFKKDKVGSSEIPAIMGFSPYQTAKRLLALKRGEVESRFNANDQQRFALGHEIEASVREQYYPELIPVVIQSEVYPEAIASLDCVRLENGKIVELVEVKSTQSEDTLAQVKSGECPKSYFAQIQWQLFLTGLDTATLFTVHAETKESYTLAIKADTSFQTQMISAFSGFLKQMTAPKLELSDSIVAKLQRLEMLKTLSNKVSRELASVEDQAKALAQEILTETNSDRVVTGSMKIETIERVGAVMYDKIESLKGVNLDLYRRKPSRYVKVTMNDGAEGKDENEN
jgi:putative phage-type endonuclease